MDKHIKISKSLASFLDNKFEVFGFKFGIDPIVGLVPVLGDILPIVVGFYIAWIAYKLDIPKHKIVQIILNTLVDFVLGLIPVLGDFGDFTFKSYIRNYEILEASTNNKKKCYRG